MHAVLISCDCDVWYLSIICHLFMNNIIQSLAVYTSVYIAIHKYDNVMPCMYICAVFRDCENMLFNTFI
jgi:hypothetical protein